MKVTPNMVKLMDAALKAAADFDHKMAKMQAMLNANSARQECFISGLEARMYVRAALDPAYTDSPDALVRALMNNPLSVVGYRDIVYVRPATRARLAAAALRGWTEHREAS